MKLTIQIDTDNSAFRDRYQYDDIDHRAVFERIKKTIENLEYHAFRNEMQMLDESKIKDLNGNTVGIITIDMEK